MYRSTSRYAVWKLDHTVALEGGGGVGGVGGVRKERGRVLR